MSSSKVADYAKSLESLTLSAVKLKDAGVLQKESVQKVASIFEKFLGKIETEIDSLDFSKPEEPAVVVAPVVTPAPANTASVSPTGEKMFGGKTFKELNQMNSAPLFKLASDISKSPNCNPNVPLQGQKYEMDWRMDLINYIVANAAFLV